MNKATFDAMQAQYAVQDSSGEGLTSWDNGAHCVMPSVEICGKAEQTTYTGKNLLNLDAMLNDCIVKTEEGYKFIRTDTQRFSEKQTLSEPIPAGTILCLSAEIIETTLDSAPLSFIFDHEDSTTESITLRAGASQGLRKLSADVVSWRWYAGNTEEAGTYTLAKKVQIEEGSTVTSYEPYTGGIPAPNPEYPIMPVFSEGTTVAGRGKNLFDFSAAGKTVENAVLIEKFPNGIVVKGNIGPSIPGASVNSNGWFLIGRPGIMHLNAGELVVVSALYTILELGEYDEPPSNKIGLFLYGQANLTKTTSRPAVGVPTRISQSHTIPESGLYYPVITLNSNTVRIEDIQIEYGTTATPYTPYFDGGTAVAPELLAIPGTECCDTWDAQTGIVTRRCRRLVFTGEESWRLGAGTYPFFAMNDLPSPGFAKPGLYSHGTYAQLAQTVEGPLACMFDSGILRARGPETITTVDAWKAWLSEQYEAGTPVTVAYQLLEPYTEQYTPQPLIQPKGVCNIIQADGTLSAVPITAKYVTHS